MGVGSWYARAMTSSYRTLARPFLAVMATAALLLSACAPSVAGEGANEEPLFDAAYDGPIETIAVLLDTDTNYDTDTETALEDTTLFSLLDHPYAFKRFDVIERERLNSVLDEFDLAESGLVDLSSAAEVGRLLGAQSILLASINSVSVSEYGGVLRVVGGAAYDVRATIQMRLVDVETGRIIAAARSPMQQVVPGAIAVGGIGAFGGSQEDAALLNLVNVGATRTVDDLMRTLASR